MVRRIVMLGIVGAVIAAAPASAFTVSTPQTTPGSAQWHTQTWTGNHTHSRAAHGSCTISGGAPRLNVRCPNGGSAKVVYQFIAAATVKGKPTSSLSRGGTLGLSSNVKASGATLTVTVSFSGHGSAWIDLVSVGYYA